MAVTLGRGHIFRGVRRPRQPLHLAVFLLLLLVAAACAPRDPTHSLHSATEMRTVLLQYLPLGASVAQAQNRMEQASFLCRQQPHATWTPWELGMPGLPVSQRGHFSAPLTERRNVSFLSCWRTDGGRLAVVQRQWAVAVVYADGRVTDVLVNADGVGP